jgi:2-dehydro-3-deoxygluconokinase
VPAPLGGDRPDVVGFGEALVLLQPPAGASLATMSAVEVHVAGAELNVCAAVAALGGSSVLCTRLGDDPLGQRVLNGAARLGVRLAADRDPNRPTGVYFKDVRDDGARHVYYYRSTSAAAAMTSADAERGLALRPRAVVVSGLTAALGPGPAALVRHVGLSARQHGAALVMDVNLRKQLGRLDEVHNVLADLLPHTDLLIVGTDESKRLLGSSDPKKLAHAALNAGCREVVVKAGADGCWWIDQDGTPRHEPSAADAVVDPVGGGDAFSGGYLSARLSGADESAAARLASVLAARVIAATGDTAGLPDPVEGRRLMADLCL